MTDLNTLRDDLAFMRALAEEGRRSPVLGRSVLLALTALSGLYGAAAIAVFLAGWSVGRGLLGHPPGLAIAQILWAGVNLGGLLVLGWLAFRLRTRRHEPRNPATAAALRALLFAFVTLFGCLISLQIRGSGASLYSLLPAVVGALYGAGWSVAAAVTNRIWHKAVAGGAMLFALATTLAPFPSSSGGGLLIGAALLLLGFAPGLALLRQSRSEDA